MKIGVSCSVFLDSKITLTDALNFLEKRIKYVELLCDGNMNIMKKENIEVVDSYNLKYTLHCPLTDLNLSSFREKIRLVSLDFVKDILQIANKVDSSILVLHPGYCVFKDDYSMALESLIKTLKELNRIQEEYSTKITIENMPSYSMFMFREPDKEIFEHLGDIKITFDIGHAFLNKNIEDFLDKEVIEVSKRFFPSLSRSFEDPRAIVINEDGYKYIQDCEEEFDVIIVDSTDPVGFAHVLTTEEFFRLAFRALREEGIFAAQTESLHYHLDMVVKTQKSLRKVFPVVDLYTSVVPIYAGYWWTYSIASKKHPVREPCRKVQANTRIYSEEMHRYAFLPTSFYERVLSGDFKY